MDDFAESFAMWGNAEVTRFIGGKPSTSEEAWARLLRHIGHWRAMGYGYWVVETLDQGLYVGEVGFGNFRREMVPPLGDAPEAGWVLVPRAHGKGYAFEAASAALAWRDTALPSGETVCIINPEHTVSLRLADKLGFRNAVNGVYHGNTLRILRREARQGK